ncbi:OLC1v1008261C1 [Oldenlandia corymbosa var. corymbosa]|uniref:OLC1v1008261C1 n=1 Tax=Oldenlandia corymbosa var. corymbosa TaxID=529605 RepID=A0AAV1DL62_OLDCO|nr:OLC1v1008261C1 [Oldenlandia corymbosa var. corymbosa]
MGSGCCSYDSTTKTTLPRIGYLRIGQSFFRLQPKFNWVPRNPRNGGLQSCTDLKVVFGSVGRQKGFCFFKKGRTFLRVFDAMDDDSVGVSSFHDHWEDTERNSEYGFSSSEGEDSDSDIGLQPITDIELPIKKEQHSNFYTGDDDSVSMAANRFRFAMLGNRAAQQKKKKRKSFFGMMNNVGLVTFLTLLFSLVDWCGWKIVRLPLPPFHLLRPFVISTATAGFLGYVCVPLLRVLKIQSIRKEGLVGKHSRTPTMAGLYFIPTGVVVAEFLVGFSSAEVFGASAVTLSFAVIGLIDDLRSLKNDNTRWVSSSWMEILLEVVVTAWFLFWYYSTANISSPYCMKLLAPLPAPVGILCLGTFYPILASFCFFSMASGVRVTDGLDGLAGGIAALAFTGMSIAVLPICSDLAVFGASMAGACVGFLFHNRYKASVLMGDTGALALGGALAAMAACTGMFFPLFITSGIFVLETLSVIVQGTFFKTRKHLVRTNRRPFHQHLELRGVRAPAIVAGAYLISSVLVLVAGYVGLISA